MRRYGEATREHRSHSLARAWKDTHHLHLSTSDQRRFFAHTVKRLSVSFREKKNPRSPPLELPTNNIGSHRLRGIRWHPRTVDRPQSARAACVSNCEPHHKYRWTLLSRVHQICQLRSHSRSTNSISIHPSKVGRSSIVFNPIPIQHLFRVLARDTPISSA